MLPASILLRVTATNGPSLPHTQLKKKKKKKIFLSREVPKKINNHPVQATRQSWAREVTNNQMSELEQEAEGGNLSTAMRGQTEEQQAIQVFRNDFQQWIKAYLLLMGGEREGTVAFDYEYHVDPTQDARKHLVKTMPGLSKTWEQIHIMAEDFKATAANGQKYPDVVMRLCDEEAILILKNMAKNAREMIINRYEILRNETAHYTSFIWPTKDFLDEAGKCLAEAVRLLDQISIVRFEESMRACSYVGIDSAEPATKKLGKKIPKEVRIMSRAEYQECLSSLLKHHQEVCKRVTRNLAIQNFVATVTIWLIFLRSFIFGHGLSDTAVVMIAGCAATLTLYWFMFAFLRAQCFAKMDMACEDKTFFESKLVQDLLSLK